MKCPVCQVTELKTRPTAAGGVDQYCPACETPDPDIQSANEFHFILPGVTEFRELDACTYECVGCGHSFEYSDMGDPGEHPPKFCPSCGRGNR